MATTLYETLLPEIIPMVPEAPDALIENKIRAATVEFCERTNVYQKDLDPITAVEDVFEYDFDTPAGTVVHKIIWASHDGRDLEPISPILLEQRKPKWRDNATTDTGMPEFFVKQSQTSFWVVPTPSSTEVDSIRLRVALRPTHSSTSCDSEVMDDYRDAIVNGTLFRLLRTPGQDFTDFTGATAYGSLFEAQVIEAERRARQGDTGIARKVNYGGLTSIRSTRKYSGRRLHKTNSF